MSKAKEQIEIRDRIRELRRVRASDIALHPLNPRTHGETQREQLRGMVDKLGVVEGLLAYYSERNGGQITLIDGEMRSTEYPDYEWPCQITDLNDAEADEYLLLRYPIESGAGIEKDNLEQLLSQVKVDNAALDELLAGLASEQGLTWGADETKQTDESQNSQQQLGGLEYRVIVECASEQQQADLLERFELEGLTCRALIS